MSVFRLRTAAWVCLSIALCSPAFAGAWRGGIGVIGDSYSDEYRFYPPDRSSARNWVELLHAVRGMDFGPYTTEDRGEPRRQGFAYNWARSDATTVDMISAGQHLGVAEQAARGEVGLVAVFIGGNDFIYALKAKDAPRALNEAAPRAIANVKKAVETILAASPQVRVLVATIPDIRDLPEFREAVDSGRLPTHWVDHATASIRAFNKEIRALARSDRRIGLADLDVYARLSNLVSRDYVLVAGRKIDRNSLGNDLDHIFLKDQRHAGTIGQGLLARAFIDSINSRFGAGLPGLGDDEIVGFATTLLPQPPLGEAIARETGPTGSRLSDAPMGR